MKINSPKSVNGFTIVELLIVIVVIAILAAISIVAYVGIQERAVNIAKISTAKQALSLLESYRVINGTLPHLEDSAVCIGDNWPCGLTAKRSAGISCRTRL